MNGFQQFQSSYKPTDGEGRPSLGGPRPGAELIAQIPGFPELIGEYAGSVLNAGLYRLLDDLLAQATGVFISYAFPVWQGHLAPFGCDWMGRIYAVDGSKRRSPEGELCVMLLDPATRDLLRVPAGVTEFHNDILISDAETALEQGLWTKWRRAHNPGALTYSEVAGWRKPGFLGGSLNVSNLEVQPAVVYWELSGQLIAQAFDLKPGTPINSVKIE